MIGVVRTEAAHEGCTSAGLPFGRALNWYSSPVLLLPLLQAELDAQSKLHSEELGRIRTEAGEQIAHAEARGRRVGMLDKEIAEATIK